MKDAKSSTPDNPSSENADKAGISFNAFSVKTAAYVLMSIFSKSLQILSKSFIFMSLYPKYRQEKEKDKGKYMEIVRRINTRL